MEIPQVSIPIILVIYIFITDKRGRVDFTNTYKHNSIHIKHSKNVGDVRMKHKQVQIVLHVPSSPKDISYLQELQNELVATVLRKELYNSGASKQEKTEYLTGIINSI